MPCVASLGSNLTKTKTKLKICRIGNRQQPSGDQSLKLPNAIKRVYVYICLKFRQIARDKLLKNESNKNMTLPKNYTNLSLEVKLE